MRRDVFYYIESNIEQVYNAYLAAATNKPFERSCTKEPFHTIAFGVNFSMKYNMNGGACNIHLMPSGSGTAVNIRFSIAQATGARYEKYAQDLNTAMKAFLPVEPRPAKYNVEDFLRPENQITPASLQKPMTPTAPPVAAPAARPAATVAAPAAAPATAPVRAFCGICGNQLEPNDVFCTQCGTRVTAPAQRVCPSCKRQVSSNAAFCGICGTRL